MVEQLIQNGANVNKSSDSRRFGLYEKKTPLIEAAIHGNMTINEFNVDAPNLFKIFTING